MTFPADLRTLIQTAVPSIGERIYPLRIPNEVSTGPSTKPCVVYQTSGVSPGRTFCGYDGATSEALRVDAYARDYDAAYDLGRAVASTLDNFSGTVGGTRFLAVFVENEVDLMDPEPGLFRRSVGLTVWHRRP